MEKQVQEQIKFDFDVFQDKVAKRRQSEISEAREGLQSLKDYRSELDSQREILVEKIETLDEKISRLESFLSGEEEQEKETTTPRDRGVLIVLRQIISSDWDGIDFEHPQDFDTIVKEVRKIKPTAKIETIKTGLLRLVKNKDLVVEGIRGNRVWRIVDFDTPQESLETPPEPAKDSEPQLVKEPEEEPQETPTRSHDDIVSGVREKIMTAVLKKPGGIDAKMMAWIMTEESADEVHFEAAVRQLEAAGSVEVAQSLSDDCQVIRVPVSPDSKEGLKRVRIEGKPLFPNMNKPHHA